jgi:hypothetical protein
VFGNRAARGIKCSGLRHTATSSRAVKGAGSNRPCSRNPLSGFSTCIGWPRLSLAVDGLGLTFGRFCGGRFTECALRFAVGFGAVREAEAKSLLEIPNCVDHRIDWTDEFVSDRRNSDGELANAVELF